MIDRTISHYKVTGKLGEGGMGVVYKAEDTNLKRPVALKFLAAHLLDNEEVKARFRREAEAAAALNHPNVCHVYEISEVEGKTFIAMAFLEGEPLEKKIEAGPLKLKDALDIAIQTAKGLQAAHRKKIVHRDIKPANLMIGEDGHVTIMDFGLALLIDRSKLTRLDETMGTVTYMSPEQTYGMELDHRTDVWSLGVVIYEMVAGQRPFKGHYHKAVMYSITNEEPEPLTSLRSGVPMEFEWVVGKTLAKDLQSRYQSTVELIVDLETLQKKLRAGDSRGARSGMPAAAWRGPATPAGESLAGTRQGEGTEPMPAHSASVENLQTLRKRRLREMLLDLGGKGLLPDSILSQALEVIAGGPDQGSEVIRRRDGLLDDLLYERVRVGEFIEGWHRLESRSAAVASELPREPTGKKKRRKKKGKESRSEKELFGFPLWHRASGRDPATGRQRVAKGVIACGDIAIGVVAFGRWLAVGGFSVRPVSLGLCAIGLVAVGLETTGLVSLSLAELTWRQVPLVGLAVALAWGIFLNRRRSKELAAVGGEILDRWALFAARQWRAETQEFRGGNVIAMFGRYEADLSEAELAEGEVVVVASAVFGAVKLRVPQGWKVTVEGVPILGRYVDKTDKTQVSKREGSGRPQQLLVKGLALVGSVRIEN